MIFVHLTEEQEIGYLEDTLSDEEQGRVEAHMKLCKYCRMGMEIGKEVLAGFYSGTLEDEPIPQEWIQKALRIAEREWAKGVRVKTIIKICQGGTRSE